MGTKTKFYRRRWGDHDVYFGPLTFAKESGSYRPLAVYLDSGGEEHPGASLHFSGLGCTMIAGLPQWALTPHLQKVAAKWDAKTVERLGRDWYYNIDSRRFGFSLDEGHLNFYRGRQTMDSSTEERWSCFLPWTQWRPVRHSFYGYLGEHIATLPETGESYAADLGRWQREREVKDGVPCLVFAFGDFDGESITAKTKIEEREWRFGTGWFKWLSLFRAPRVSRSLDLSFSSEVGKRKGSWKGGTVGHSIEMAAGELHEEAFRRYCGEHGLTFKSRQGVEWPS